MYMAMELAVLKPSLEILDVMLVIKYDYVSSDYTKYYHYIQMA